MYTSFKDFYSNIAGGKEIYLKSYKDKFPTYNDYKLYVSKNILYSIFEQYAYVIFARKWLSKYQKNIIKTKGTYREDGSLFSTSYFLKLTDELKEEILKLGSFFNLHQPYTLENICFYKDGYCYFSSETHEDIADLNITEYEEYEKLKNNGLIFYTDYIPAKKEDLYYEEY